LTLLRTLIIAECLPYPPLSGKDLRNWQNVYGLSTVSQVGVFGLCADDPNRHVNPPRQLAIWQATDDPALTNPPPANQLSAASRLQLNSARAWPLDPLGHPCVLHFSNGAADEIANVMASFKPQVVVVESLWPTRYLNTLKRFDCRIIFDCHNVEAKVYQEIADSRQGDDLPARLIRKLLPSRTRMAEEGAVQIVDQLWVCSDIDKRLMIASYGDSTPIEVIPNSIDVSSYDAVRGRRYQRPPEVRPIDKVIIFPAVFGYQPNVVAATFLIEDFFPRLATLFPDCQLLLAGSRPTPEMIEAGQKNPRIIITDTVADMKPYLAASSIMVVPLFQGGGTRFKILEAFAANLPVVSTSKGAEGLAVQDGKHLLIAENIDEFIAGVRRIWAEPGLANYLKANAMELLERHYSLTAVSEKIRVVIRNLDLADRLDT
jgi:glycosyltransferase involved in cell wall biosynthesis